MKRIYHSVINLSAVAIIFLTGVFISYGLFENRNNSYYHKVIESKIIPPIVKSGSPISTHVVIERNVPDNCFVELHRFITESKTGVVVWTQIAPGIVSKKSEIINRRIIEIPKLPPGKYEYRFKVFTQCQGGISVYSQSAGASFDVID